MTPFDLQFLKNVISRRLLKTQKRSKNLITTLSPFCTNEWNFSDGNVRRLWSKLAARDRILFPFDVTAIDWVAYMRSSAVGFKRFVMKEEVNTGPRHGLYIVHRLSQLACASAVLAALGCLLKPFLYQLWPSSTINFISFVLSKR
ncbi:fatty acyl-CoA reductase wat-like [Frankliniella occidentalis]|uniref:Fatty acyl-CoA reductase wat-like n=1 Tax=Frankliniella occidentalis TaxID=133901 RepID=A0A9C6XBP5_FRAOC|nr:fatty acyl-CoA reductase wat-like [Frankliniella occidentalis]